MVDESEESQKRFQEALLSSHGSGGTQYHSHGKKPQEFRKKPEKSGTMDTHMTPEPGVRHGSTKNLRLAWTTKRGLGPSFKRKQKGGRNKRN